MADRRVPLSRSRIIDAAATVADRDGAEQLTLAATSRELNASVPAVLKHVRGNEDLRASVGALALVELSGAAAAVSVGLSRLEALAAVAQAYRDYGCAHPGRYALGFGATHWDDPAYSHAGEHLIEVIYKVLAGYELSAEVRVDAVRILRATLHGFVSLENAGGFAQPRDVDETFAGLVGMIDRTLREYGAQRSS